MTILIGRILKETVSKVYIEVYGTYDDWYDEPNTDMQKWVRKDSIESINDSELEPYEFTQYLNTEEALEIGTTVSVAGRFL